MKVVFLICACLIAGTFAFPKRAKTLSICEEEEVASANGALNDFVTKFIPASTVVSVVTRHVADPDIQFLVQQLQSSEFQKTYESVAKMTAYTTLRDTWFCQFNLDLEAYLKQFPDFFKNVAQYFKDVYAYFEYWVPRWFGITPAAKLSSPVFPSIFKSSSSISARNLVEYPLTRPLPDILSNLIDEILDAAPDNDFTTWLKDQSVGVNKFLDGLNSPPVIAAITAIEQSNVVTDYIAFLDKLGIDGYAILQFFHDMFELGPVIKLPSIPEIPLP